MEEEIALYAKEILIIVLRVGTEKEKENIQSL
jgi:hypothetical protein